MTICRRSDQAPNWKGAQRAKRHLSDLLGIGLTEIDLVGTESLNTTNQFQKTMLTFSSNRLPLLIHKLKPRLSSRGVFPTQVFLNSIVVPLCKMRTRATERPTKPKPRSPMEVMTSQTNSISQEEKDMPGLNSQNHAQHQYNQEGQKEQPISLDNQPQEFQYAINPLKDDFLNSFRNLSQEKQQTVIKRLDLMSQTLKENKESEVETDNRPNVHNCLISTKPLEFWTKMRHLDEEELGTTLKKSLLVNNLQSKGPMNTNVSTSCATTEIIEHLDHTTSINDTLLPQKLANSKSTMTSNLLRGKHYKTIKLLSSIMECNKVAEQDSRQ
uniref:uncharacterized protein LOC114589589 n=1 Tax=Podarcis muralis TaxID=64176 RepID=UPI0010A0468B|nr:uncharacterized protein LOC114589589 [Podarcis muralis]